MLLIKIPTGSYFLDDQLVVEEDLLTFGTAEFTVGNIPGLNQKEPIEIYETFQQ